MEYGVYGDLSIKAKAIFYLLKGDYGVIPISVSGLFEASHTMSAQET